MKRRDLPHPPFPSLHQSWPTKAISEETKQGVSLLREHHCGSRPLSSSGGSHSIYTPREERNNKQVGENHCPLHRQLL